MGPLQGRSPALLKDDNQMQLGRRGVPHLVDSDRCAVIFDTSPARNLAYVSSTPDWVDTFAQMREQGYSFSLADHACGELIAQRSRGAITDLEHNRLIRRLASFIDAAKPVMLGEVDVLESIGAIRNRHEKTKADASDLSRRGWRMLCEGQASGERLSGNVLDEDRTGWRTLFEKGRVDLFGRWQSRASGRTKPPYFG